MYTTYFAYNQKIMGFTFILFLMSPTFSLHRYFISVKDQLFFLSYIVGGSCDISRITCFWASNLKSVFQKRSRRNTVFRTPATFLGKYIFCRIRKIVWYSHQYILSIVLDFLFLFYSLSKYRLALLLRKL